MKVVMIEIKTYVMKYLDKIKLYLRDIIINLRISDTRKFQLTIAVNFIFSEERVTHSKSNNLCHVIIQMKLLMNFSYYYTRYKCNYWFRNINVRE